MKPTRYYVLFLKYIAIIIFCLLEAILLTLAAHCVCNIFSQASLHGLLKQASLAFFFGTQALLLVYVQRWTYAGVTLELLMNIALVMFFPYHDRVMGDRALIVIFIVQAWIVWRVVMCTKLQAWKPPPRTFGPSKPGAGPEPDSPAPSIRPRSGRPRLTGAAAIDLTANKREAA